MEVTKLKTFIGRVDAEVIEVIEYFEGEPIVLRLVDAEIPCFEVSIALYSENDSLVFAARDGKRLADPTQEGQRARTEQQIESKPEETT